jgi:ABC-type uncharacterized transport system substrate-binding protein
MMPFAVFVLTKIQSERGIWVAETTIKILKGEDVSLIPLGKNQKTQIWHNSALVDILGIRLDESFLKESKAFKY